MFPDRIILCYHAVSDEWPSPIAVRPGDLHDQLALLHRRGYRGVTFTEAVRGSPRGRVVALTFDDAHLSVHEHARPELGALGWPATVFVPTRCVGPSGSMAWEGNQRWMQAWGGELRSMGWPELAELATQGWEIGSHTRTHPFLPALSPEALKRELVGSRQDIETEVGIRCESVAYPYGAVDARVIAAARAAGYVAGAATRDGVAGGGDLARQRVVVGRGDAGRRFRWKSQLVTRRVLGHPRVRRVRAGVHAGRVTA